MATPRAVVYGYYEHHESLALGYEDIFQSIVRDIAILQSCATIGALRAAVSSLSASAPSIDEEYFEDRTDDEPWEWTELSQVADGDWPPMPTEAIFAVFPDEDPIWPELRSRVGAETQSTTLNGSYVWIDPEKETLLLQVLREHGIVAERDDGLVLSASMYG